jgi:hypothetical protein
LTEWDSHEIKIVITERIYKIFVFGATRCLASTFGPTRTVMATIYGEIKHLETCYVQVFEDLLPTSQVQRITISKDNRLSLCRKESAVNGDNRMKYCVDQVHGSCRHSIQLSLCVKALS